MTPSVKVTEPSGDPLGVGVTVAVSVTVAPVAAGFGEATSAVVVETGESRPVPVSEMVCRPPPSSIALSAIATMAVSTPVLVVGVNSIPKTQLWPGVSVVLDVHVVSPSKI